MAFASAFVLILSAMPAPAAARAAFGSGAAPKPRLAVPAAPVALGAPAKTAALGAMRRHHRRRGEWGDFGGYGPVIYNAPPAASSPASEPPGDLDDVAAAPSSVACGQPRVLDLAPVRAVRPLPVVIYGSPPPCARRPGSY